MTRGAMWAGALMAAGIVGLASWAGTTAADRPSGAMRVDQALEVRDHWDFDKVSISELAEFLRKRFQIAIHIDRNAFETDGIDLNKSDLAFTGVTTLSTALDLALAPEGVTYYVRGDVLVLTTETESEAQSALITRVYPVGDLVKNDYESMSLMQAIMELPMSLWEVNGDGTGTLTPVPAAGSMVICQTWRCHRQITGLLQALRKARGLQNLPSIAAEPAPVEFASYEEMSTPVSVSSLPRPSYTDWRQPRVFGRE